MQNAVLLLGGIKMDTGIIRRSSFLIVAFVAAAIVGHASDWYIYEATRVKQDCSVFFEVLPAEDDSIHYIKWYMETKSWKEGGVMFSPSQTWGAPQPSDDNCWLIDDVDGKTPNNIVWWEGQFMNAFESVLIQLPSCDDSDGWLDIYVDDKHELSYDSFHPTGTNVVIVGYGLKKTAHKIRIQNRVDGGDVHLDYVASPACGIFKPTVPDPKISVNSGGVVNFSLDASETNADRTYLVVTGMSGTSPGTPLPGGEANLPINMDILTEIAFTLLNSPMFENFLFVLNGDGQSTAKLALPGNLPTVLIDNYMYFAYCLNAPFDLASNPVGVKFVL
jgi:hypothetical protein